MSVNLPVKFQREGSSRTRWPTHARKETSFCDKQINKVPPSSLGSAGPRTYLGFCTFSRQDTQSSSAFALLDISCKANLCFKMQKMALTSRLCDTTRSASCSKLAFSLALEKNKGFVPVPHNLPSRQIHTENELHAQVVHCFESPLLLQA